MVWLNMSRTICKWCCFELCWVQHWLQVVVSCFCCKLNCWSKIISKTFVWKQEEWFTCSHYSRFDSSWAPIWVKGFKKTNNTRNMRAWHWSSRFCDKRNSKFNRHSTNRTSCFSESCNYIDSWCRYIRLKCNQQSKIKIKFIIDVEQTQKNKYLFCIKMIKTNDSMKKQYEWD